MVVIILGAVTVLSGAAFASSEKYRIQTTFQFKDAKQSLEKKGEVELAADSQTWTTLVSSQGGFVVLGRLRKADSKTVAMEYIVVDSEREKNGVVSTPSITARIGEAAEITSDANNQKIMIGLLAEKK